MKALSFEDVEKILYSRDSSKYGKRKGNLLEQDSYQLKELFNLIRQGTLLEEEAIRIPQEKDWPEGEDRIECSYVHTTEKGNFRGLPFLTIPRPQPIWTPRRDDPVFVLRNGYLCVGKIHTVHDQGVNVQIGKEIIDYPSYLVKPFSLEKITSAWEDI